MADHRASVSTLASQLEDELNQIQIQDHYELTDVSTLSSAAQPGHDYTEGPEEQRLLNVPSQVHVPGPRYRMRNRSL